MSHFNYLGELKKEIDGFDAEQFSLVSSIMYQGWQRKSKFWVVGNGGNSANALHFVTDWTKGLYIKTGLPMSASALTENSALFSALANDIE